MRSPRRSSGPRRGLPGRAGAGGALVLHVDRAFTIRGAGTVVTGTLWSGGAGRGDAVELLPAGRRARVRGVQVHDEFVDRAQAGQRVALNLAGVGVDEVARGDVVVAAGPAGAAARAEGTSGAGARPVVSYRVDAALEWASPEARPDGGARVAVHHGTREVAARLAELGGRYAQLRLERPLVTRAGDRLVIRALAPPDTLGGGVVLDASPQRHGPSRDLLARLARLERGEPEPAPSPTGRGRRGRRRARARRRSPRPRSRSRSELRAAGAEPPLDADLDAPEELAALRAAGRAVRLGPADAHPRRARSTRSARASSRCSRPRARSRSACLRDELGTSRKYAQALLEHFDAERLTLRRGDARVLRRRGSVVSHQAPAGTERPRGCSGRPTSNQRFACSPRAGRSRRSRSPPRRTAARAITSPDVGSMTAAPPRP